MHPDNEWSYLERISIGGHATVWAKAKADFRGVPSPTGHGAAAYEPAIDAILWNDPDDGHPRTIQADDTSLSEL